MCAIPKAHSTSRNHQEGYGAVFFSDSDHSTRGKTTLPGTMEPVKALPYRSLFDLDFQSSPWGSRPILQMSNELRLEIH